MTTKRPHADLEQNEDDSDDDFGPMPAQDSVEGTADSDKNTAKKARKAALPANIAKLYTDNLPCASFYEHSFMHRDIVTHIAVSKPHEFVITASFDGHVKFWKKMHDNIEFVKHYHAHLGPINSLELSPDGSRLMTTSDDKMIKFFEVVGFDLSHMLTASYVPGAGCWIRTATMARVAVADKNSGDIHIYRTEDGEAGDINVPVHTLTIHSSAVASMAFNKQSRVCVSVDMQGMIEYWSADTYELPSQGIKFKYKSETDLYDLMKSKAKPCTITMCGTGRHFAIVATDKVVRVYDFQTGKLRRKYDESVKVYKDPSKSIAVGGLDSLEMGRREAIERDLENSIDSLSKCNAIFDESGNFLIYGSLLGIKIVDIVGNTVVQVVGLGESGGERFLHLALYQGTPKVDAQYLLSKGGSETRTADQLHTDISPDPTIYCTSFKKRRFYCFSRREPNEVKEPRDVFNEMPTEEEKMSASTETTNKALGREAVVHTTLGDIEVKLFSAECPRTVENFCTHARNGYYNGVIFHRVIKGFMVQTGDPRGDGTGGESIWGGEFEDEIVKTLKYNDLMAACRHDRPFTLSMANAGPNTNGSQFFFTTVPTPWLDNKHTVFGRVTKGFQVITTIENVRVNKHDKPFDEIKILSITIKN